MQQDTNFLFELLETPLIATHYIHRHEAGGFITLYREHNGTWYAFMKNSAGTNWNPCAPSIGEDPNLKIIPKIDQLPDNWPFEITNDDLKNMSNNEHPDNPPKSFFGRLLNWLFK